MPRSTNLNGMRSIILHNIFKQSKRLTKQNKDEITKYIHSLSIDELKKKGLTKQIVTQYKNEKPRKTLTGGMKRPNDNDDEDDERPKKRSFLSKAFGFLRGKSYDENEYTLDKQKQKLEQFIEDEKILKKNYEEAQRKTHQAQRTEEIAKGKYELMTMQKESLMERNTNLLRNNQNLINKLEQDYNKVLEYFNYFQRRVINGYKDEERQREKMFNKMNVIDMLYFRIRNQHLPHFEESSVLQQSSPSSSSSSASSSSAPAPEQAPEQEQESASEQEQESASEQDTEAEPEQAQEPEQEPEQAQEQAQEQEQAPPPSAPPLDQNVLRQRIVELQQQLQRVRQSEQ